MVRWHDEEAGWIRRRPDWQFGAACRDTDIELFFSTNTSNSGQQHAEAKAICHGCQVREECFRFGLYESRGIWGGFTAGERYDIRNGRLPMPTFRRAA